MMDNFLTATCDHWNNPTGALLVEVATDIACSPIDPVYTAVTHGKLESDYPNEKLYRERQTFTKYAAFVHGDRLISGGVTYVVKTVQPWAAQGGMDAFYHLILEHASGS